VSETVTAVVYPCSSSSKLFSGIFLMNKNGQHSYKFLMIFHFGITIKIGHGLLKNWLGTLWSVPLRQTIWPDPVAGFKGPYF